MTRKKVLIFVYYWPPAGGPGVQRMLKFCRYLPQLGWDPVVVTPKNGAYPYFDESLIQDVPNDLEVHKTKTREPFAIYNRLRGKKGKEVSVGMIGYRDSESWFQKLSKYIRANFFIPDARRGWMPFAKKKGMSLLKSQDFEAMISSGPPHSTHLTCLYLKKKFPSVKWVADFRDPWTNIYYNKFFPRTANTKRKDASFENAVLGTADHVVTISESLKMEFEDRCQNISVIYNGYDDVDMPEKSKKATSLFRLAYIGNFKPNQNLPSLWEALSELKSENSTFSKTFRLKFTGVVDPSVVQSIVDCGLEENLELEGFVKHNVATKRMVDSNVLLFVIPQSENNKLIITGKIFENLASRTPMLSIGPKDGDAAAILSKTSRADMLDYLEKEAMKIQISKHFTHWNTNGKIRESHLENDFQQFSRVQLTHSLVKVLR